MPILNFTHQITEKRNFGTEVVNQKMEIVVKYDPDKDNFYVIGVYIHQNGAIIAEVSKLLHKAEGNPLNAMVESIDWKQQFADSFSKEESIVPEPEY